MGEAGSQSFYFVALLASLQEGTKAQDFVKHSANEFANSQNHINEIMNFFTSHSCNCVIEV
ncbi:hypothetical protein [Campylobacter troglodytis]|uniref:hypothetical protein n=1 Tax=Campylobacter troglodytis TaxID=654363 RepID=UPI00115707F1|nr:hypothetical protein [Campylobacter troglodytis]TQR54778.1 hypothetical protein DMC01_09975 [Campylobacter troglodytis]